MTDTLLPCLVDYDDATASDEECARFLDDIRRQLEAQAPVAADEAEVDR